MSVERNQEITLVLVLVVLRCETGMLLVWFWFLNSQLKPLLTYEATEFIT